MDYRYEFLSLLLRLFLGSLFFLQGYEKLFRIKISGVVEAFQYPADRRHIPMGFLKFSATISSLIEFIGGIFLILGLFKYITLYALGLDILMASIAFGLVKPMWDMKHVFPRLVLLSTLLLLPPQWDPWTLDKVLGIG